MSNVNSTELIRVIYEKGITAQKVAGNWYLLNGRKGTSVPFSPSIKIELDRYHSISATRTFYGTESESVSDPEGTISYQHRISTLQQLSFREYMNYWHVASIVYLLSSVNYHCVQLSKQYSQKCKEISDNSILTEYEDIGTSGEEIFFEFDALITSIRRTYDALRYPLWKQFGLGGKSTPSAFYKTLPLCTSLSSDVLDRLNRSWSLYGNKITEYRDCIQHYVPVGVGTNQVFLERLGIGVWSVSAWIPDNPSVKSHSGFRYSEHLDALTYGWMATNEILDVAEVLLNAIKAQNERQNTNGEPDA